MEKIQKEYEISQNRRMLILIFTLILICLGIFIAGLYTIIDISTRVNNFMPIQVITELFVFWKQPVVQVILFSVSTTLLLDMFIKKRLNVSS